MIGVSGPWRDYAMNRTALMLFALLSALSADTSSVAQQLDRTARLMEELTNAPGPSGFEGPVREIVVREFGELNAAIEYDGLGSVIATLPGAAEGPRIMVTAHLDEVGLMVQHVRPDGFIKFKTLGGWLRQALPDQRWMIVGANGPVLAISGLRTVHVTPQSERSQVWASRADLSRRGSQIGRRGRGDGNPTRRSDRALEPVRGASQRPIRGQGLG